MEQIYLNTLFGQVFSRILLFHFYIRVALHSYTDNEHSLTWVQLRTPSYCHLLCLEELGLRKQGVWMNCIDSLPVSIRKKLSRSFICFIQENTLAHFFSLRGLYHNFHNITIFCVISRRGNSLSVWSYRWCGKYWDTKKEMWLGREVGSHTRDSKFSRSLSAKA